MNITDLFYIIIIQITLLLFILLSVAYFFRGRDINYNFKIITKLGLASFIGFILSFTYIFNISNSLYILIIAIGCVYFYLGLKSGLVTLFVITLFQKFFYQLDTNLLLYFGNLFILLIVFKYIKKQNHKYYILFILSLLFLNLELYLSQTKHFFLFNLVAIFSYLAILFSLAKIEKNFSSFQQYRKRFFYDQMTNIKNYYCLLDQSPLILKKSNYILSVVLINIDHLKDINNLYGNSMGDNIIKIVSKVITENVSNFGEVYRIDGDTFCIVSNERYKIIKTICDKIKHQIDIKEIFLDNNKVKVSVSIGGYCSYIHSKNIDDYLELAQDELNTAKFTGKNKVIFNNQT